MCLCGYVVKKSIYMSVNVQAYHSIIEKCTAHNATLVTVSKTKPIEDIQALYNEGQRAFGENYVQEIVEKQAALPNDIQWHFIGHLQTNKVKYIVPFVHLIHGVDSEKLLLQINKEASKLGKVVDCLLQVHIAQEETKFGFDKEELASLIPLKLEQLTHVRICGLMGMASFTEDTQLIEKEFKQLKSLFDIYSEILNKNANQFHILSMGMSADYQLALHCGSNLIRIGSLLFGKRN